MSIFTDNFDRANEVFATVTGEQFELVRNGNVGVYDAVSIDDIQAGTFISPGGFRSENNVLVHVSRTVLLASAAQNGSVLIVRGERVRIGNIVDDGDNTVHFQCGASGVKI